MDEKEEMECVEEMGDIFVGEKELEREVELKEKEEKVDTEIKGKNKFKRSTVEKHGAIILHDCHHKKKCPLH